LYQQAIKEGAKLVVGPLDKKDIKTLVDSTKLTIPVLALNHIEGLNQKNLYQFALSPIDDAEQITLKAHRDGHHNALFLVPKTEQGKRFANYFTDSWQKLGDKTVSVQFYNDDKTDFSNLTQKILQHNNSDDLVENNIDTLIINAYPKSASLVYPSLQDSQTTVDLPIYATSQIYLGDVDANRDKALEDITFCDVPWMFEQVYTGNLSKSALHKNWENLSPNYLRLLPMGIDAYALITQLSHLKEKPYSGATGKLRLDEGNRITRELFCAKFVNGIPKMLDFASENQTSESLSAVKSPVSSMIMPEKNKSESPKIDEIINSQSSVGIDDGFIQ
jgi:outer membrane PBP1 activator LpoA protein